MLPPIKGFIENTLLDWEGKLAAVVFLPGCNLRCGYCHARGLIEPSASDESIPLEVIQQNLRRQGGWIDGVVISGGEPALHAELPELIESFRSQGVQVKLDTNGTRPEALEKLLARGLLDYVAMDLKAPLDERYARVARAPVDLDAIRHSIAVLLSGAVACEFRTTVCPADLDGDDIEAMAQDITGAPLYYLQSFRPVNCLDRSYEAFRPYNTDQMREFCRRAAPWVGRCAVRGDEASALSIPPSASATT